MRILSAEIMVPSSGNSDLVAFIRRQISTHGPVTFKWFMQQVLYHPEFGYYGGGRARIGRRGDFYTSVSVGKIFGELMAKQFEEMWLRMNSPLSFAIVEEGAHGGHFAHDVLQWLHEFSPELYSKVKYWIVEPNPRLQAEQQSVLSVWPRNKVRWCQSLSSFEIGTLCGVHFSNELLDSFAVHLVTTNGGPWQENFVDTTKNGFRFVYGPPSNTQLHAYLAKLPPPEVLSAGGQQTYRTEVNLSAMRWIEDISKALSHGYILLADYGFSREDYYLPARFEGTLTAYQEHQRSYEPLENIGHADLTAHVDFTSLAERAEASGLRLTGFCDQHHFLVGLGEEELLELEQSLGELTPEVLHYIRSFKTLMHPSTMGMACKFICFEKNVPANDEPLAGFRHGGDGREALRLNPAPSALSGDPDDPYAAF
jgi:SAM-dependent MidA family methyltransferase